MRRDSTAENLYILWLHTALVQSKSLEAVRSQIFTPLYKMKDLGFKLRLFTLVWESLVTADEMFGAILCFF